MGDDERKKNGDAGTNARARRVTPVVTLPGPEAAARRLAQLGAECRRTAELCDEVARLAREGGFGSQTRAKLVELADHFEIDMPAISAGTGRALRRLAQT